MLRVLGDDHRPELDVFLERHADSSMFLRSNVRRAGITYEGKPFQCTYVGAFDGERLVGVIAHAQNGNLLVQAPAHVEELATLAVAESARSVEGMLGPCAQVRRARVALGVEARATTKDECEDLFSLALVSLCEQTPIGQVRRATANDIDELVPIEIAYDAETLGREVGEAEARTYVERVVGMQELFVLVVDGRIAAKTMFTARLPDCVQLGGVYTPPALRRRGYSKAVVAASLRVSRDEGVERAVLFTDRQNVAARRVYASLGFVRGGDYALVLFAS